MLLEMFQWTVEFVDKVGYLGVFVMMTLESTFVPLPSELVMPQAGYLAAEGRMNLWIAVLMATVGSILGALINYGLAYWLGRPFLLKYGKYVLCPPHKFEKMEKFFQRHGEVGTFTGRLVLGVRHFISFPAGLARMNLWHFCFYPGVGAGLWALILGWIGYKVGLNKDLLHRYYREAVLALAAFCVLVLAVYAYIYRRRHPKSS
jgi:membrane protein DedA with SNARE-associated domain